MSEKEPSHNEELARAAYDALNRGDREDFVARVHPEVEFMSLVAEAEGATYHGHEGVREWWDKVASLFGGLHFDAERVVDFGDRAYVQILVKGTVEGVEIQQRMWQAFILRDGKPIWWRTYRTEAEARAAMDTTTG